ncbi:hypothetical protein D3C86_1920380 [compost metagenome]
MVGRRDEVFKGVLLVLHLAVFVPGEALVLAAADMGDGIDDAAVCKRKRIGRERRRDGYAIGAITVEQAGRRTVEWRPLFVEQ